VNGGFADIRIKNLMKKVLSRENITALLFALLIIGLIIFTVDNAPQWIYQGF
jgi:hypothetical protein